MIDSLTQEAQDYDEYNRKKFRRRRKKRRILKRRRPPVKYGNLGFPIKVRFPTKKHPKIVKGTPNKAIKLPPVKQKVSIDELVAKTNSKPRKRRVISAKSKAIKHKPSSIDNSKKTSAKSDSRVGKIAKVVAGIGLIGVTGYIIYRTVKFQKQKQQN